MANVVRNFVEYSGITEDIPEDIDVFKEFVIHETLNFSDSKPDIQQVIKVVGDIFIVSTRVIKTPIGTSLEGQNLTGWKAIVEGEIVEKIEYVADKDVQSVHVVMFNIPFSNFIVLPEDFSPSTQVFTSGYIQDISIEIIDKKTLFNSISILLTADAS